MNMWRYARFHGSVMLAWLAFGVLIGLMVGIWLPFSSLSWVWLLPVMMILVGAFRSRRWFAVILVIACGVVFGVVRASGFAEELRELEALRDTKQTIVARISQDPTNNDLPNVWQTQLSSVRVGSDKYTGEIFATVLSEKLLRRGDEVRISGMLREGFGSFAVTMYRANLEEVLPSNDKLLDFRNSFGEAVRRVVPEPEASLGLGFLVGQKSALDPAFEEQLRTVGLTHIVVASGYNLTVLVRFARRILARHSRYLALVSSLGMIVLFVGISGMSPSMNRAAVVTVLSLVAWYYGRTFHPVKLILYVAAGSALAYPTYLWSDLGWMLSFAAFFGVLVVSPLVMITLKSKSKRLDIGEWPLLRLLVETTSAQIMTLPILAVTFGNLPVVSLLANMLVAPVVPFAMALTALAGMVGWLTSWVWLAVPASTVLAYVVSIVHNLANISWASVNVEASSAIAIACYVAIGLWVSALWFRYRQTLESASIVV
ncbi:ComEC family competence protein [Candidatus Saccharibacteria bacterium]|nr:ComEC family competence protein [Candidatus Saccharibacteria bacterium]